MILGKKGIFLVLPASRDEESWVRCSKTIFCFSEKTLSSCSFLWSFRFLLLLLVYQRHTLNIFRYSERWSWGVAAGVISYICWSEWCCFPESKSDLFLWALYYMCTPTRLWDSFALLSLTQPLPQLCPSACSSVTFLTPTYSNHTPLSLCRSGRLSPITLPPQSLQPSASSVLHTHLWLSSGFVSRLSKVSYRRGPFSPAFFWPVLKRELRNKELYLLLLVVDKECCRADALLVPGGTVKWGRQTKGRLKKTWIELQSS